MSRLLVASLLLGSFALSACSSGSDTAPAARIVGKNNPSSCLYQANEGGRALTSNLSRTDSVKSDFFDKYYDRADLEAVLSASGTETARYIGLLGIELFKIPYAGPDDRCLYEDALPTAPVEYQDYWTESGGKPDDAQKGLDGLWLFGTNGYGKQLEIILVRASSDRWTLTHEMMHSNFNAQRMARGEQNRRELAKEISSYKSIIAQDLRSYSSAPSEAMLTNLIDSYDQVSQLLYKTLVQSSLEEIANESLLLEEWSASRFKSVTDGGAWSAARYIKSSRASATEDLKLLFLQIEKDVTKPAYAKGWTAVSDRAQAVQAFLSGVDDRTKELQVRAESLTAHLKFKAARRFDMASESEDSAHLIQVIDKNPAVMSYRDLMKSLR